MPSCVALRVPQCLCVTVPLAEGLTPVDIVRLLNVAHMRYVMLRATEDTTDILGLPVVAWRDLFGKLGRYDKVLVAIDPTLAFDEVHVEEEDQCGSRGGVLFDMDSLRRVVNVPE